MYPCVNSESTGSCSAPDPNTLVNYPNIECPQKERRNCFKLSPCESCHTDTTASGLFGVRMGEDMTVFGVWMGDGTTEESCAAQKSSILCKKKTGEGQTRKHDVCFGVEKQQRIQRHQAQHVKEH